MTAQKAYVPDRNDIIWLDFEPPRGKEIGKYRPALVLSSENFNQRTGILICCPISTSIRGGSTEVPVGNLEKPSVVVANLIHTLDWRDRDVERCATAEPGILDEVLVRLIPLIGADRLFAQVGAKK